MARRGWAPRATRRAPSCCNKEPNAFVSHLRECLTDLDSFCDERKFPGHLTKYAEDFRNRAMHVDDLSAQDCKDARDFLLDEPVCLLRTLLAAMKQQ